MRLIILTLALLAGCAGQPVDYKEGANGYDKPGAGIFDKHFDTTDCMDRTGVVVQSCLVARGWVRM